ncbi:MAG: hypothetical protein GXO56_05945 [Chloroflexi bacterium]|nr:hypothetical protein [Chloroflexota bacterium]
MKKHTLFRILALFSVLALGLAACSSSNEAAETTDQAADVTTQTDAPESVVLLVGTWKLDGTPQEITAEQAAKLLPLWQLFQTLSTSDTTAPEEVEAVLKQIKQVMTPEQLEAIAAMNITLDEMRTFMQEMGVSGQGGGTGPGGGTGQPPAGMVPGMGGGGGNTSGLSPQEIATAQAQRASTASAERVPGPLMNGFIEYLQTKAGQ